MVRDGTPSRSPRPARRQRRGGAGAGGRSPGQRSGSRPARSEANSGGSPPANRSPSRGAGGAGAAAGGAAPRRRRRRATSRGGSRGPSHAARRRRGGSRAGRRGGSRRRRPAGSPARSGSPGKRPSRSRSRGGGWQRPGLGPPPPRRGPMREQKPEGCRTIWIGWLENRPKEEDLVDLFKECGAVTEVRISDHQVRGYFAHLQFEDTTCVDLAMKKQGDEFMGRRIQLDYAYMDKVMTNPEVEASAPGRILRCKPKSVKPPNGHTLWLGDLSIDTTEQDVIDLFEPCGKIEMICLKVNQLRNGHFGHVKFYETEAVDKAAELAGTLVKGVPLRMDFAEDKPLAAYRHGKTQMVPESVRPDDCRTVFVGGLPGEVTEELVRELFDKCGTIREIRLDMSKRSGAQFCHVEFVEGDAVDRAVRLSGDRMGSSKIRVDYAENRKHDPKRPPGLPALGPPPGPGGMPGMGPPPGMMPPPGLGPMGMPPPGAWMPPPGFPPNDWLRGPPPSDWTPPPALPPPDGNTGTGPAPGPPGTTTAARPPVPGPPPVGPPPAGGPPGGPGGPPPVPGAPGPGPGPPPVGLPGPGPPPPGWMPPGPGPMFPPWGPPPFYAPRGPGDEPARDGRGYPPEFGGYYGPPGGGYWPHGPPPMGYGGGYPPEGWPPGVPPPGARPRSRSCGSGSYSGSYSYSYSYTPSPSRSPNPKGRSPNPKGRSPNPKGRSPNPKGRSPPPKGRAGGTKRKK